MKNILSTMAVTLVLSTNFAFAGDTGNTPGPANVLNIPISSVQLTEKELDATRGKNFEFLNLEHFVISSNPREKNWGDRIGRP